MSTDKTIENKKIERYSSYDYGESYDNRYAGGINSLNTRVEQAFVEKALESLPDGALVLDAGCGTGRFSTLLARRFRTVSLDTSLNMLESLRAKSAACLPVLGNIHDLPFAGEKFSAAVSIHVLFHLPRWPEVLKGIASVLSPGAPVVFEMRSGEHVRAAAAALSMVGIRNVKRNSDPATLTQYASRETVEQALFAAGFRLSGVYSYDYAHAYYNKPVTGLWERVLGFGAVSSLAAAFEEKAASVVPSWLAYRTLFVGIRQ